MAAQRLGGCKQRALSVNVVDAHGQQILGLTSEQFRAAFQGQPVKVMSAKFEGGPQRILMLVDGSGSMWFDAQQRELIRLVANDMVSSGPPQAQLALATFSSNFEAIVKFGQDREAVREGILGLNPTVKSFSQPSSGETALNDAILEAANMFENPHPGDVVYAITDGLDNGSKSATGRVRQYLEQRNIRLFVSVIHNPSFGVPRGTGAADGAELVINTAKETGGYHVVFETDGPSKAFSKAKDAVRQLYKLMASFYALEIELPKEPDKPRELKLMIVDVNGSKEKGVTVLHSQNVFPCAVSR